MVGIYRIINLINNHSYIGQSRKIEKRWANHKIASANENDKGYNYPLYRAFRKYGLNNFKFEVIEECSIDLLNEREAYWIEYYKPEYNQTIGGDYNVVPKKLSNEQVKEIQQILINNTEDLISHKEIANKYNVSKDTIRDINVGRTWYNEDLTYPLHMSKYTFKKIYYCNGCGKEISKGAEYCISCINTIKVEKNIQNLPVTREELKNLIRNTSFSEIGRKYGCSDNAIKKWCDKLNLPRLKKDIKQYSDEEWSKI